MFGNGLRQRETRTEFIEESCGCDMRALRACRGIG